MRTNIDDPLTGAVAEVALVVDLPVDEVWELVTDEDHPDRARAALDGRLAELRRNMTATVTAMMDARRSER